LIESECHRITSGNHAAIYSPTGTGIKPRVAAEHLNRTLNERKSRMAQIQGFKGEVVVVYCEPLIKKKMGYYRLS